MSFSICSFVYDKWRYPPKPKRKKKKNQINKYTCIHTLPTESPFRWVNGVLLLQENEMETLFSTRFWQLNNKHQRLGLPLKGRKMDKNKAKATY